MPQAKVHYFKHKVGDGRHYINDNFVVHENGDYQQGDPSDICILLNAEILCDTYGLTHIWELWTKVYPDDPMNTEDAALIISEAKPYTEDYDPTIPDNRADVLKDLRDICCNELADLLQSLLDEKRAYC